MLKKEKKIIFQKIKNIFSKTKLSSEEIRILISVFKKKVQIKIVQIELT